MVFFRPAILLKKTPIQVFSREHRKIFKNTYFEKHLRTAASDSSYILLKKLNIIVEEPDCLSVSLWNIKLLYFTYSHSHSIVLSRAVIRCHSVSFFVTRCHSLSIVVPLVVTRCHLLHHSLSFYKRSFSSIDLFGGKDVKFQNWHDNLIRKCV